MGASEDTPSWLQGTQGVGSVRTSHQVAQPVGVGNGVCSVDSAWLIPVSEEPKFPELETTPIDAESQENISANEYPDRDKGWRKAEIVAN